MGMPPASTHFSQPKENRNRGEKADRQGVKPESHQVCTLTHVCWSDCMKGNKRLLGNEQKELKTLSDS